jgi:hypothetical protein
MGIGSSEIEEAAVPAAQQDLSRDEAESSVDLLNASTVKAEVAALETELKAKIAAVEQTLENLKSSITNGVHGRLNEVERIIKSKFPYA